MSQFSQTKVQSICDQIWLTFLPKNNKYKYKQDLSNILFFYLN